MIYFSAENQIQNTKFLFKVKGCLSPHIWQNQQDLENKSSHNTESEKAAQKN